MSNFRELGFRQLHVNGQRLNAYEGQQRLTKIPGTDLYIGLDSVSMGELAKAANLPGAYDYALPQSFFDEWLKKYGERPLGVWWYPPKADAEDGKYWLGGRFVGVPELLVWVGKELVKQGWGAKEQV